MLQAAQWRSGPVTAMRLYTAALWIVWRQKRLSWNFYFCREPVRRDLEHWGEDDCVDTLVIRYVWCGRNVVTDILNSANILIRNQTILCETEGPFPPRLLELPKPVIRENLTANFGGILVMTLLDRLQPLSAVWRIRWYTASGTCISWHSDRSAKERQN